MQIFNNIFLKIFSKRHKKWNTIRLAETWVPCLYNEKGIYSCSNQSMLCNNDYWRHFLKQVYIPMIPPGQNRAWSTLQGGTGKGCKVRNSFKKASLRIFSVIQSTSFEFFMELEKLRASFELNWRSLFPCS